MLGVLLCGTLFAETSWPSERDRISAYKDRCDATIQYYVDLTDPNDPDTGSLFTIAANLGAGKNIEWARARMRAVNNPPSGNMFWMHPMVLAMYAGKDYYNESDWDFIKECWRSYFPFRGDTENHWLMYYTSLYLACQMFRIPSLYNAIGMFEYYLDSQIEFFCFYPMK